VLSVFLILAVVRRPLGPLFFRPVARSGPKLLPVELPAPCCGARGAGVSKCGTGGGVAVGIIFLSAHHLLLTLCYLLRRSQPSAGQCDADKHRCLRRGRAAATTCFRK
jgi:hypothetical protein